uniref:ATP synthase subunit a n=1 Tax=Karaftohelix adamsi TaxID=2013957 RepID=A0A8J9W909_9EUPU|nr:ATP synthase F0 subunit 6 [Karaftohelix adamsi]
MYTDLFSSMDGARSMFIWVWPMLIVYSLSAPGVWLVGTMSTVWKKTSSMWYNSSTKSLNMMFPMALGLFLFLLINNIIGLSPYTYSFTSNLFVVSSLSILFWFTLLWSGYMKSPMKSLAHLAPSGAPLILLPFLVLVETISIIIRPLTLTVRLVANISAGHIVLGLLANLNSSLMVSLTLPMCAALYVGYTMFEFFVGIIQAYIFTLLLTLYCAEHP